MILIKRSIDGQFYFKVIAKNGEPLCNGETHKRKENAIKSVHASLEVMRDSINEILVELETTKLKPKKKKKLETPTLQLP